MRSELRYVQPLAAGRVHVPRTLSNLSLAAASVIVALGGAEVALRTLLPPSRGYFALPPGADWTLIPAPQVIPGVVGISRVRVNRFGVPRDTTALYDDVHFNERGSRLLARVLAEHFRKGAPFRRPGRALR